MFWRKIVKLMPFNVLFIEASTSGGGSLTSLYSLISKLDRSKFNPIVCFFNDNHYISELKAIGVKVFLLDDPLYTNKTFVVKRKFHSILFRIQKIFPIFDIYLENIIHRKVIKRICHLIQSESINLIHLNNQPNRDFYGIVASKKSDIPCISHIHSRWRNAPLNKRRCSFINENVSIFFSAAEEVKKNWGEAGLLQDKIFTIYNGIFEPKIKSFNIYSKLNIPKSYKKIIGAVGKITNYKGQKFLLESFSVLAKTEKDVALVFVGDGDDVNILKNKCKRLGISERVFFAGYTNNALEYISSFDVLIQPSQTEVCSMVLLEAMALKTAIIATNVGGTPELIKNDFNGLLVEYENVPEMLSSIKTILSDEVLRVGFIKNGYAQYKKQFQVELFVSQVEKKYLDVLQQKK